MDRRHTIQKDIVLAAVRALATHSTADEVYDYIHQNYPNVGRGTVYRNLNVLAEEGAIRKVGIPGGADRYDFTCHEHYHVTCVKCGDVCDVDMDVLPNLMNNVHNSMGMELLSYDILFRGICPKCKALIESTEHNPADNC